MRFVLTAVVTVLACAAPASAATVSVSFDTGTPEAVYVADPGQRNDVTATQPTDFTVRVHEEAAPLTPGEGCTAIDDRTVECEGPHDPELRGSLHRVHVLAGDMDDIVRSIGEPHPGLVGPMSVTSPDLVADGGPGDDMLIGGDRFDRLNGGGGRDTLLGMGQTDFLDDGDTTGAADADVLDGGDHDDVLTYAGRTAAVTLDLGSNRPAGEAGEGDTVRGIEIAHGGSGDDRLTAAPRWSTVTGGDGDDTLTSGAEGSQLYGDGGDDVANGGPGRDLLYGGRGDDVLTGGADFDTLDARFGRDSIDCDAPRAGGTRKAPTFDDGEAHDPERPDLVTGCTVINYALGARGWIRFEAMPVLGRSFLTLGMGCRILDPDDEGCLPTSGRLRVAEARGKRRTVARRMLGPNRYPRRSAPRYHVRAPLTAVGRRLLARGRATLLTVTFRDPDLPEIGWTVRVEHGAR
jgi:hypothetical protein